MPAAMPQPGNAAARSSRLPPITTAALAAAGLLTYAAALVATLPAQVVARGSDAAGTAWHGAATLPGGATVRWDWSLGRSLAAGALAFAWTVDGPDTLLTGVARRGFGGTSMAHVAGRAGWPLLAAAVPGLPPGCTIPLDVALDDASAAAVDGTIRSRAGTCSGAGRGVRAVPRMIATFAGAGGRITPWSDRATTYATVTLGGDAVHLHVTPAGAAVLPGPGGASDIEFAL